MLWKTCVNDLKATKASTPEVEFRSSWNGGTHDRKYAKESLAKERHLPEAIEAVRVPGLPEMEAVKPDQKLTCEFSPDRIRRKLDTFS